MLLSFNFLSKRLRIRIFDPRLSPLFFCLLISEFACTKSVHSVGDDNFYMVRTTSGLRAKDGAHRAMSHEEAPLKNEKDRGLKSLSARANIANASVLEQTHPVVVSLIRKIETNPNDPQNHYELALVYHQLRIFDKALLEYEKAIETDFRNPAYYEGAGRLCRDWGMPKSGVDFLQKALELRPSYTEAWNTLGTIYDQLNEFSEAQRCYLKALEYDSGLDFVHSNLCFSYLQTRQVQAAVYYGERAVQLNPSLTQAWNNLGVAYFMANDFVRTIEQFKRIGDEAEAHNNLGVLLLKNERNSEAMEEFKLAVRLKPFYRVAAQNYNAARSLIAQSRSLLEHSAGELTDLLPGDSSFGADSLDFSIPAVDLRFIRSCRYLWVTGPQEKSEELLVHPAGTGAKTYEISSGVRRSVFSRG